MKSFSKMVLVASLLSYVLLAITGLIAMEYMHQHQGSMNNCPFMVGQQSVCSMSTTEHINSWQSRVTTLSFELFVVIVLCVVVVFTVSLHPPNLKLRNSLFHPYRENEMANLFSQGILHSKVP